MIRDFRPETKETMLKYIEEMKDDSLWGAVKDFIGDLWLEIKHFFKYTMFGSKPDSKEELEKYHQEVADKADALAEEVNSIFELANEEDANFAARAAVLNQSGQELLSVLKQYTGMATPSGIVAILSPPGVGGVDGVDVAIVTQKPEISDMDLAAFSQTASTGEYYRSIVNVQDAVVGMDVGTAFLIALFNHDDILLNELLNGDRGDELRRLVRKMMLDEGNGLISASQVAKELGVSKELVNFYLKNGSLSRFSRDLPTGMGDADFYNAMDKYIRQSLDTIMADKALCEKYCAELGLDQGTVDAILKGNINEYSVKLYKESIIKSLQDVCGKMEIKLFPGTKKILSGLNDSYKLMTAGDKSDTLKKIWENGIMSDAEARDFLKTYCGFDKVSGDAVKTLRNITGAMNTSKEISDYIKYGQQAIDMLSYWLSDYSGELDMLDRLMEANSDNPEYVLALTEIREEYSNKFAGTLDKAIETIVEEGVSAAKKEVPLLGVAETAISLGGQITGAKGHADAAEHILAYASICPESVDAYDKALQTLKTAPTDEKALNQVRSTFSLMKQTLTDYYDAQIEYADGYVFGIGRDKSYQAYLSYQKNKIENLRLGDDFTAISYESFMEKYGGN